MLLTIVALGAAGFASVPASAGSLNVRRMALPDTSDGIHIGIPFDYCYTTGTGECAPYSGKLSSLIGKVDAIWGASQPTIDPSITTLYYFPAEMDRFSRGGNPDPMTNTAYQYFLNAGHFDWLAFKGGFNSQGQRDCSIAPDVFDASGNPDLVKVNENLAWESFSTNDNVGRVPLDITNPAVLDYQMQYIEAALASGYSGVALDSFYQSNVFGRCGVFRQVNNTWQWVPLYGTADSFQAAADNWLASLYGRIKAADPSAVVALNYSASTPADLSPILPSVDAIFDERGVTQWGSGYPTEPDWNTIMRIIQVAEQAGKAYFLNGEIKASSDSQVPPTLLLWELANYLLVKSNHTYTYVASLNPSPLIQRYGRFYDRPEYHIPIGHPVVHPGNADDGMYQVGANDCYARDYSAGMTYVNSSSTQACVVTLSRPYNEVRGHSGDSLKTSLVSGSLSIPPTSGAILLNAPVTSTTVGASDSSTVSQSHPHSNYHKQAEVMVVNQPKRSNVKWGLFRFDLTLFKGQKLISARFECAVTRRSRRAVGAYLAGNHWSGAAVDWANKPRTYQKIGTAPPSTMADKDLSINVTKALHLGQPFSLVLKEAVTGSFACASNESSSPPDLALVTVAPASGLR
jgi:hypothetical protein